LKLLTDKAKLTSLIAMALLMTSVAPIALLVQRYRLAPATYWQSLKTKLKILVSYEACSSFAINLREKEKFKC
jgi:hypothetical protein